LRFQEQWAKTLESKNKGRYHWDILRVLSLVLLYYNNMHLNGRYMLDVVCEPGRKI